MTCNNLQLYTVNDKDTNRKIRTTFFIDYCVLILVPNSWQDVHIAFCVRLTSPQTSLFTVLLVKPFLEPLMYMNSVFLIFLMTPFQKVFFSIAGFMISIAYQTIANRRFILVRRCFPDYTVDNCIQAIWAEPHQIQSSINNSLIDD